MSDSDYYLDMGSVFAGDKPAFDATWSDAGHFGAHHYSRPLLPFLAAVVVRAVPRVSLPRAFSLVNVFAAWVLASALYGLLARVAPDLRYPWLPSALFLTGFPQMNWGYHLLTDTIGYATAFVAALVAWAMLERDRRRLLAFVGLFVLQSLAFLARETAWMVPVVVAWLVMRGLPSERRRFGVAVLATVLLAYLPRVLYVKLAGVTSIAIPLAPDEWLDPGYVFDFAVKSAVAFNPGMDPGGVGSAQRRSPGSARPHGGLGGRCARVHGRGLRPQFHRADRLPAPAHVRPLPISIFSGGSGSGSEGERRTRPPGRSRVGGVERRRGRDRNAARSGRERDYRTAPDPARDPTWALIGAEVSSFGFPPCRAPHMQQRGTPRTG